MGVSEILVGRNSPVAVQPALFSAFTQGSPDASAQGNLPSSSGAHWSVGLARERMNLATAGLPWNATIQGARASSTRYAYDGK